MESAKIIGSAIFFLLAVLSFGLLRRSKYIYHFLPYILTLIALGTAGLYDKRDIATSLETTLVTFLVFVPLHLAAWWEAAATRKNKR